MIRFLTTNDLSHVTLIPFVKIVRLYEPGRHRKPSSFSSTYRRYLVTHYTPFASVIIAYGVELNSQALYPRQGMGPRRIHTWESAWSTVSFVLQYVTAVHECAAEKRTE